MSKSHLSYAIKWQRISVFTDENQGAGQDVEDDVANYNGDDDNQPEPEDEKQLELAEM